MSRETEVDASAKLKEMTQDEAVRFLVRVANAPAELEEGDPGVIHSVLHGMRRYLLVLGEGQVERDIREVAQNPDGIGALAAAVAALLRPIARVSDSAPEHREDAARRELKKFSYPPKGRVRRGLICKNRKVYTLREGRLIDVLMETAAEDFDALELDRLRVGECQREGCGQLFYKLKLNQTYCNHQCANRAAAGRRSKPKKRPIPAGHRE